MGGGKLKGLINSLLLSLHSGKYAELSKALKEVEGLLGELSQEEARALYRLLGEAQKELKLKGEEIASSISKREKVKGSYGKCSL